MSRESRHRGWDQSCQRVPDLPRTIRDVAGVGQGSGEEAELGDHQGVSGPACGEGPVQIGAFTVSTDEPVVDIDQILWHAKYLESDLPGDYVLLVGGDACVPDQVR